MQTLVFVHRYSGSYCSCKNIIVFDYESKEAAFLELCKRVEEEFKKEEPYEILIGSMYVPLEDLGGTLQSAIAVIEANLLTLQEFVQSVKTTF